MAMVWDPGRQRYLSTLPTGGPGFYADAGARGGGDFRMLYEPAPAAAPADPIMEAVQASRAAPTTPPAPAQAVSTSPSEATNTTPGVSGIQTGARTTLNNTYPLGFEAGLLPFSADDAIIDAIIAEQRGDAVTYLDRALGRGQLLQPGYDRALADLNNQEGVARSRLSAIGEGVLSRGRDDIASLVAQERDRIGTLGTGSPAYDINPLVSNVTNRASELTGRLEGDIRAGIIGEPLFDTITARERGAAAQGVGNPVQQGNPTELLAAMQRDRQRASSRRGVGSQGSF